MALQTPLLLRSCPLRRPIASFILLTVTTQKCGVPPRAARQFAYEDVGAFLRFLQTDVKVTEQVHLSPVIEKLFSVVDPVHVVTPKPPSNQSPSSADPLLPIHLSSIK